MISQELISIREASRRLGVSDTALHKAIKAGRIKVANLGEKRPKLAWPAVQTDFVKHSDVAANRQASSVARKPRPAPSATPRHDQFAELDIDGEELDDTDTDASPDYQRARARRTHYLAKLAKLAFDEKDGSLVSAASVKSEAQALAAGLISTLYSIPDRLSDQLCGMTDANAVHALIVRELDLAVAAIRRQHG